MSVRTRVKICGVRDRDIAGACAEAGADAIGLVFAPGSARVISVEEARAITRSLPPFVASVGLFVDAPEDDVREVCASAGLTGVQLHGSESPEACVRVAEATGLGVIKGLRFDPRTIEEDLARWSGVRGLSALLLDGSTGGLGETFDWRALASAARDDAPRLIVAGGLTPDNVADAIATVAPYAVDVSSGVERFRGEKDVGLIRAFLRRVRAARAGSDPG